MVVVATPFTTTATIYHYCNHCCCCFSYIYIYIPFQPLYDYYCYYCDCHSATYRSYYSCIESGRIQSNRSERREIYRRRRNRRDCEDLGLTREKQIHRRRCVDSPVALFFFLLLSRLLRRVIRSYSTLYIHCVIYTFYKRFPTYIHIVI